MQNWIFTLVMNTLVTSILVLLLSVLSLLLKSRLSPGIRYYLWVTILLSLIVPIRPIFGQGVVKISSASFEQGSSGSSAASLSAISMESPYDFWASLNNLPWIQIVLLVWFLGFLFFFGRQLFAYWNFKQMIKRWGNPILVPSYIEALHEAKLLLNCKENIQLIHYPLVKSPMMTGLLKPILLLPELDYADEELDLIFEHELTHLKHRDIFANLLSVLVTSIYWFNPIVYFAAREMQEAGELYCDFSVLKRHGDDYRFYYGETILTMIDRSRKRPVQLTTCFYSNKFNLKRRIVSIMEKNGPRKILSLLLLALIGLSIALSGSIFVFATQTPIVMELQKTDRQQEALVVVLNELGFSESDVSQVVISEKGDNYELVFYQDGHKYTALVRKSDLQLIKLTKNGQSFTKESQVVTTETTTTSTTTTTTTTTVTETTQAPAPEPVAPAPEPAAPVAPEPAPGVYSDDDDDSDDFGDD